MELDVAERALGDVFDDLEALGFIMEEGGQLRGALRIVPHEGLLIASDNPRVDASSDHVAGVHGPSIALASMTVRRPVGRALDVGTGNGIQALLLAGHADRVVATDINERALAFATLNAELNGVDNIEFRAGSFLEPVEGERFGLVVANPPYLISPETDFIFRDSGLGRDRVSESLVRALPNVMEEGSFATVTISWITAGDDTVEAPRNWLDGSGCDAWLFRSGLEDPLTAAASWNNDAVTPDELGARVDKWLEYFERESVGAIAYGTLVLRRRAGENWFRTNQLPARGPASAAHLTDLFDAQARLATLSDDDLLQSVVDVSERTWFEHRNQIVDGEWKTTHAALAIQNGLQFQAKLDAPSAAFVARIAPARRVGDVIADAAQIHGAPLEEYTPPALALLRRMIELGFATVR